MIRAAFRRLVRSLPKAALFAPLYGAAVTGSVVAHMAWYNQAYGLRMLAVIILFALGGTVGGFLAWVFAATVAGARPRSARFAAMCFALILATAGITAFFFFLQYRLYYAQWHDQSFSEMWIVQMIFTGASAVYIFAVSGLRMLLPFGLPVLFLAALVFARKPRG